jgi:hypothetical protein
LTFAFIWKRNPGIHPGCHIAAELVILGGNLVAFIFIGSYFSYGFMKNYDDPGRVLKKALILVLAFFA